MDVIESHTDYTLRDIVAPFADLMDEPSGLLPDKTALRNLQNYYHAGDHPDFNHPAGYQPWTDSADTSRRMRVPYSLALGLHPAGPRSLNEDDTRMTFEAFAATQPLFLLEPGSGPRLYEHVQRERARSVLVATILDAAINPSTPFSQHDAVKQAIRFSREEHLLTRRQARLAVRAAVRVYL